MNTPSEKKKPASALDDNTLNKSHSFVLLISKLAAINVSV